MYKKSLVFLFVVIVMAAFLLAGCGSDNSESTEKKSSEKEEADYNYTGIQTEMSNYMNEGMLLYNDGWIYSVGWGKDTRKPLFMKMRTDETDDEVIKYYESPTSINIVGEYIYVALVNFDSNKSSIYRYRLGGDKGKKLVKNAVFMQIVNDEMYYCKCKNASKMTKYCKSDLSGKNETVILDKEIYYPYVVDDLLYYQDDKDNETIHVYDLKTKEDTKITKEKTYGYVLDDDYMYCVLNDGSTRDDDYNGTLVKVDLKTHKTKKIYEGASTVGFSVKDDEIFFVNTNDKNRIYKIDKEGDNISIVAQDTYCRALYIYGDQLFYLDCSKNYKYTENIFECDLDGSNKIQLTKYY